MAITSCSDEDFRRYLQENDIVVVNFYAEWAGTSKILAPKFIEISENNEFEDVLFLEINVDQNPLTKKGMNIKSMPTFALFKDGQLVEKIEISGSNDIKRLEQKIGVFRKPEYLA